MIDTRIDELMMQMQSVAARATGPVGPAQETLPGAAGSTDFAALLKSSIDAVNDVQQHAGGLVQSFELGDPQVELNEVMVALQKADISFKAMTEVRNLLVDAYQEIMNMPV